MTHTKLHKSKRNKPKQTEPEVKDKFYKAGKRKGKLKSTTVTYSPFTSDNANPDDENYDALVEDPTRIGKRKVTKRKVRRDGSDKPVKVKYRK